MTLPADGPLTLQQIAGEFGGGAPYSMSNYYAGGPNVPAGTTGTHGAVPASGPISVYNFYGTSKYVPGTITYSTPGTFQWTVPPAVTSIHVTAIGGGAAGGGVSGNGGCKDQQGGGGGGSSGGFLNGQSGSAYGVTPGQVLTLHVGAGGTGVNIQTGNPGQPTSIDGLFSVPGGNPGGGGQCCAYQGQGDFKAGGAAPAGGNAGGKGYGGYNGGTGGAGWGGGGGGAGGGTWQNGLPGSTPGAGGGGGAIGGAGNVIGGNGANGFITIVW